MHCSVLLDLCVTARPVRLGHVIYPIMEGLSYATFSLVYWALGGTGTGGTRWIYPFIINNIIITQSRVGLPGAQAN